MTVTGTAPLTFPSECSRRWQRQSSIPTGPHGQTPTLPGPSASHFPIVVPGQDHRLTHQLPGGCQLGLAPSHPALELEWARPSSAALGSPGKWSVWWVCLLSFCTSTSDLFFLLFHLFSLDEVMATGKQGVVRGPCDTSQLLSVQRLLASNFKHPS